MMDNQNHAVLLKERMLQDYQSQLGSLTKNSSEYIRQLIPGSFVGRIFSGGGENPLMSDVTFDMLVVPLMSITCMKVLYRWARPLDFPWIGVFTSFIIVMFTMWLVSRASRRKIYWRA